MSSTRVVVTDPPPPGRRPYIDRHRESDRTVGASYPETGPYWSGSRGPLYGGYQRTPIWGKPQHPYFTWLGPYAHRPLQIMVPRVGKCRVNLLQFAKPYVTVFILFARLYTDKNCWRKSRSSSIDSGG